jgi:acetyl-CoA carboxylase carboxyl transferase subunit alpha
MAINSVLEFEKPIQELKDQVENLKNTSSESNIDITDEIAKLNKKIEALSKNIYANLTASQIMQIARHPERPHTIDYINHLFTDFIELHGDRHYADDQSLITGIAKFDNQSVVIIGHQKGCNTKENIQKNFGMSKPEGYRKALKSMKLAEKFNLPIITFVDTPGAYPGIGAEERNQSEAIGKNLYEMSALKTPIIVNIIGEGGSGGALAIAVGDIINMLEFAVYSVITPEGCASILWKDASASSLAAQMLAITSNKLYSFNLIDAIVKEPIHGAHNNHDEMMNNMRKIIKNNLYYLHDKNIDELLKIRFEKIMNYGSFTSVKID